MAVPPEAGGATPVGEEGTLRPVLSGGISRFVLQRTSLRAADADYAGSSFVALYSRRVDSRYTPIKPIGKGAYGVVCSAIDTRTGERCALKKQSGAFENAVDAKRTLREILLLRALDHENIVALRNVLAPPTGPFNDLYLLYELMDTDLHQVIRSTQPLSDDHVSYFLYQLLRGLLYIHSANVLHRDLKPSNLLLNANCDLKICDFGLARSGCEPEVMTEYVVTRWYRAPELLLSCVDYTAAIDVWSVGCILAEMLGRRPLFPGKDYISQLSLIMRTIGSPPESDLSFVTSDKAQLYLRSLPVIERTSFAALYPAAPPSAVTLVEQMLTFSPDRRINVREALASPYLAALHDTEDEPLCPVPFVFPYATETLDENTIRRLVEDEIASFQRIQPVIPGT